MLFSSTNFTNFVTISDKNNWDSLYFHEIVYKKTLSLLKVTQNQSPNSMSCWAWGSHAREWRPEMSRQISNQHWIRGEGVRVLQFLSLIVGEIPPPGCVLTKLDFEFFVVILRQFLKLTYFSLIVIPFFEKSTRKSHRITAAKCFVLFLFFFFFLIQNHLLFYEENKYRNQ